MQKIISWNVNGLRAIQKKGFTSWLQGSGADCVCLQEVKAELEQLDAELRQISGYRLVLFPAAKKGYSGVAAYFRQEPLSIEKLACEEFDQEGRVMILEYPHFHLLNCYFPNSQAAGARLYYKLAFCQAILEKCRELVSRGKNLVLCGDYNIAHQEIDLARPRENVGSPGFLPEERAWMDQFIGAGFLDTFRLFNAEPGQYTWWSYRARARENNVGWRIDYHCVNEAFRERVMKAEILANILGSDHCPVQLNLQL
ncbi:MAG: exodeoxyribonuclease III [Lentisphaeria bacterium]